MATCIRFSALLAALSVQGGAPVGSATAGAAASGSLLLPSYSVQLLTRAVSQNGHPGSALISFANGSTDFKYVATRHTPAFTEHNTRVACLCCCLGCSGTNEASSRQCL